MYVGALMASLLAVSAALTYLVYKVESRIGPLATDMFKKGLPKVPGLGGLSLLIFFSGLTAASVIVSRDLLPWAISISLSGFLGLLDDFLDIDAKVKVAVFLIPSLPLLLMHAYDPFPYVPGVGELRLTLIYPILLLIGYTVSCNALNMADTNNGIAPSVTVIILASLIAGTFLPGPRPIQGGLLLALTGLAAMLGYLPFNTYPAKVLNGNVGSFLMGSLLITSAVALRREYLLLLLFVPLGLNGFSILSSVGGFLNRTKMKERPTYLDKEFRIHASPSEGAPVTLVQLLTLRTYLTEKELIIAYLTLILASSAIALITYYVLAVFMP